MLVVSVMGIVVEVNLKMEVIMPGGDRTGPNAAGPMTGKRLGFCAGNDRTGFEMNPEGNPASYFYWIASSKVHGTPFYHEIILAK